jgi:hypothetical protein
MSPLEDIPKAQRLEVFCPRNSRWYAFPWSVLRNHQDGVLTLLSAQVDAQKHRARIIVELVPDLRAYSSLAS